MEKVFSKEYIENLKIKSKYEKIQKEYAELIEENRNLNERIRELEKVQKNS